jgi:hypothetical protein
LWAFFKGRIRSIPAERILPGFWADPSGIDKTSKTGGNCMSEKFQRNNLRAYQCPNCGFETEQNGPRDCGQCNYVGDWIQPGKFETYAQEKAREISREIFREFLGRGADGSEYFLDLKDRYIYQRKSGKWIGYLCAEHNWDSFKNIIVTK